MSTILTFDVGTTSLKSSLFDERMRLRVGLAEEYALSHPGPGRVEFEPEGYFRAMLSGVRGLRERGARLEEVEAVSITTQGETLIALDRQGQALGPAIVWLDERAQDQAERLSRAVGVQAFYRTTGLSEPTGATPVCKLMWLREHCSELDRRAAHYLLLADYLVYRLTGQLASDPTLMSSTGYIALADGRLAEEVLRAAGLSLDKLPPALPSGTVAGRVNAEVARLTGLPQGTPVINAGMDQICGMVGTGNLSEGRITETTGTCATLAATVAQPDFSHPARPSIYRHVKGRYAYLTYNPTAAIVLKWFKDELCPELASECSHTGRSAYARLDELAAAVAPGADGVLLLPHFAGKLAPEYQPAMQGAFTGLTLGATRGHLVRAILEGVGYMIRENLEFLGQLGVRPTEVRCSGGGAGSSLWNQIKADVCGLPFHPARQRETASLGAALLGGLGAGWYSDLEAACGRCVDCAEPFAPRAEVRVVYQAGYRRYRRACEAINQMDKGGIDHEG